VRDGSNVDGATPASQAKSNDSHAASFSLVSSVHGSERAFCSADEKLRHDFQVTLERSSYSDEKYALFVAYQTQIHHDVDNTPRSFRRFLVQSPLVPEPIPYQTPPPPHLPSHFGSYHQMYRLDGELIAVGVIDILPGCVSSVYFMYDAKWGKYSLGKLSALHEAALAQEIHDAGLSSLDALYMGFYIHSCPKMKYKGEYAPSFLADPEDDTWHPLKDCVVLLDRYRYAVFSQPDHSLASPEDPGEDVAVDDEEQLASGGRSIYSIQENAVSVIPTTMSMGWKVEYRRQENCGLHTCPRYGIIQGGHIQDVKKICWLFSISFLFWIANSGSAWAYVTNSESRTILSIIGFDRSNAALICTPEPSQRPPGQPPFRIVREKCIFLSFDWTTWSASNGGEYVQLPSGEADGKRFHLPCSSAATFALYFLFTFFFAFGLRLGPLPSLPPPFAQQSSLLWPSFLQFKQKFSPTAWAERSRVARVVSEVVAALDSGVWRRFSSSIPDIVFDSVASFIRTPLMKWFQESGSFGSDGKVERSMGTETESGTTNSTSESARCWIAS